MAENYERNSRILLVICLFIFLFFLFHKPLTDPDMPWHLKTGEYIWLNKTIPDNDPFSYAKDDIPFIGHFILTQYWLAQIIFYHIYKAFGAYGLIFSGAVIFTSIFALLFALLRRVSIYLSLILLAGGGFFFLGNFIAIRPQILTFLWTAIILALIERFREKGNWKLLAFFPPIMLIWANMHGGFIFGIMLMLIYLLSFIAITVINGRFPGMLAETISRQQLKAFAITTIVSCIVSLINPNTYHAFLYAFVTHSQKLFSMVSEYQTPLSMLKSSPTSLIIAYWAFLPAIIILVLYFIKHRLLTPALLLIFAVSLSFVGIRYIALFAIVSISMLRYLPMSFDMKLSPKTRNAVNICLILVLLVSTVFIAQKLREPQYRILEANTNFPIGAVAFLREKQIHGNIFSSYNKSSYLLFKLFPESRLYADSRYLSEKRIGTMFAIEGSNVSMKEWITIMNMLLPPEAGSISVSTKTGAIKQLPIPLPEGSWDTLLNEINAEIIVHEALDAGSGLVHPFIWQLVMSKEWELIYLDGTVMVFVRNIGKYRSVIQAYSKPKTAIYDEIVMESLPFLGSSNPHYTVNVALVQLLKGQTGNETKQLIDMALKLDQSNFFANYTHVLYVLLNQLHPLKTDQKK